MNDAADTESRTLRVVVSGARGRMGRMTCTAVDSDRELTLAAAVDPAFSSEEGSYERDEVRFLTLEDALRDVDADVVIDFTTPMTVLDNVLLCVRRRMPVVVGTTGLSLDDLAEISKEVEDRNVPVLVAPNFAMGAVLMMEFARKAAEHLRACEIVELHHDRKLDLPSGTSRLTKMRVEEAWRARDVDKQVPVHSVRLPGFVAHQEVIFGGLGEILTIRHDALSRESFMPGILWAIKRVGTLQGLVIGLENIL